MPVYRPKMAYKTTNVRYFDEAYQDFAPWEKYQHYHMSLSVGAKRAILGKYWQKELSKTLVQGRNIVYPGPTDPYFLAFILIPEPYFPQNFDPWALITELSPSMILLCLSRNIEYRTCSNGLMRKKINFNFYCKL